MKSTRFFAAILLIGGLFFMVSSNAMAKTRFTLEKESIDNIIELSRLGKGLTSVGYTEIASKVKLHNSSDKPLTFDVAFTFVDAKKDKLGEATKTFRIKAGESKTVSSLIVLDPNTASQIDSGYVTIATAENSIDVESHNIIASVGDKLKEDIALNSDGYINLDYNVKLRNKSSKPVTSDLTIAFLDEDNVKLGEARTKGFFEAGEMKTISDTIVLRTSDVSKIASSQVTIEK